MRGRKCHFIGATTFCVFAVATTARAEWVTHVYGAHFEAALFETSDVQESSGIIASRRNADIFWTHNDSGGSPHIWAVRLNASDMAAHLARKMGHIYLPTASNVDWEDIAYGPGPSVYVFDGGDNPPCDRTNKRIHRFTEPVVNPDGPPVALTPSFDSIRFEYPDSANPALPADSDDERFDCETLLVHPSTGDIYLVTKRTSSNLAAARVYRLSASIVAWNSSNVHVVQFVADIGSSVPGTPTGGDVDPFGRRLVVRNYSSAYEFVLPAGAAFDTIFTRSPRVISLAGEVQGEGICYAANGGNLLATSEVQVVGPQTFPIYIVPWQLANARVTGIGAESATVIWETASPLGSTINYGPTTAYGSTATNASAVTLHQIQLTNLLPETKYFYRVVSGSLAFPPPADAASVFFTTLPGCPADFDRDGDVDHADAAVLLACRGGPGIPYDPQILPPGCTLVPDGQDRIAADFDLDGDVDQSDFGVFQQCLSGTGVQANPDCAD